MARWAGFATAGVPGEDWAAVTKSAGEGDHGEELSRLSTLVISAANTTVQQLSDKQTQCNSIPMYSGSVTNAPTAQPTASSPAEELAPSSDASSSAPTAMPATSTPSTLAPTSDASSQRVGDFS